MPSPFLYCFTLTVSKCIEYSFNTLGCNRGVFPVAPLFSALAPHVECYRHLYMFLPHPFPLAQYAADTDSFPSDFFRFVLYALYALDISLP